MRLIITLSILMLFASGSCNASKQSGGEVQKQDWKLSMQSYTFHKFSVVESLEKCKELGIRYIEIYPGQRLGDGLGDGAFGYDMTSEQRNKLKELAKAQGVKIISSGVWASPTENWENVFKFAKDMEMEFISVEPNCADWNTIEELAIESGVKVACHNHPNENSYWKPEILLEYIKNKSDLLGACADVGHYKRMGVEPVPALKQLEGRLISLHFKDIRADKTGSSFEDVIWGTGTLGVKEMMEELKHQSFKGYFTIEYEADWENNLPQIKASIDFFNRVVSEIF